MVEPIRLPLLGSPNFDLRIGGGPAPSRSGRVIDVASPATGRLIAVVPDADAADVDAACRTASAAFPAWSALDPSERAKPIGRLAELIASRIEQLAALESAVTGRPIREMRAQMSRIPEWLDYFRAIALGLEGQSNRVKGGFLTYTAYEPHGVCALLTPWNHPILILVKKLGAALAAGNTVVVKPSELAPVSPLILADWAAEAGLPPGVLNVVTGGAGAGAALVGHPAVRRIDLTGGTITGKRVAAAAAEQLVPCTLELGGKTPVIVFADAPLEEAVAGALFSAFVASGQTCVSGARFLVERSVYDAFVTRFAERARALRIGPPDDAATEIGPVISAVGKSRALSFIEDTKRDGARLVAGGAAPDLPSPYDAGHFLQPTVFADVTPDMRLFGEEVFGPVVSVTAFDDEEEAARLANFGEFALGGSLWTRDVTRAHRVAGKLSAGVLWINDHHKNDPRLIWGGFGASGYGKENGWDALLSYLKKRSIVVRTTESFSDWFGGGQRYG